MADLDEKLSRFRAQLATVRGSARFKLAETIPGVREGVEVVALAEQLLVELVYEVQQLRRERDGVKS